MTISRVRNNRDSVGKNLSRSGVALKFGPLPRTPMRNPCLLFVLALFGGASRLDAADPAGTYEYRYTSPLKEFSSNGDSRLIKDVEVIVRIEFRPDHGLNYWRYSDGATKPDGMSPGGAWLTKGDQLYYIQSFGSNLEDIGSLGMAEYQQLPDALAIKSRAGPDIVLALGKGAQLPRVTGEAARFPGPVVSTDGLLRQLQAIVDGVVSDAFVGAASKESLIAETRRAIAAKDLSALMKLSYPTTGPYVQDERLAVYFRYQLLFAGREITKFEEEGKDGTGFAAMAETYRKADIWFPEPIVAEGWFKATKTMSPIGAMTGTQTSHIFYGRIGDRWAIIGDPLRLKELPPPRTAK